MSFLPKDFLFGFATAAAQIEGGGEEKEKASGRGLSIWDWYCDQPGAITDGTNIMKTCNHLELFRQDIALMKSFGVNSYRFSISWPRIIPLGGRDDPVNEAGLEFYDQVINECIAQNMIPFVTLYHWDLPLALRERYGGWLNKEKVVADFCSYAQLCFDRYGDRVDNWLTFNEPWCISAHGHGDGKFAPGVKSDTEPWIVGHSVIVAHAHVSAQYRSRFPQGKIGITLNADWAEPFDQNPENVQATQDKMDAHLGWFADPIYLGHYPKSMVDRLGDRLPEFTNEESSLLKGSSMFFGLNTYTTNTIKAGGQEGIHGNAIRGFDWPDGTFVGPESELPWLRCVPWGMRKLLNYVWHTYKTPIYITENGWCTKGEDGVPVEKAIQDESRVTYYRGYLGAVKDAIVQDGVDVRSYFAWSFMDNFEWNTGLEPRFGCVYVDYETFERTPKDSARFLEKFWAEGRYQETSRLGNDVGIPA